MGRYGLGRGKRKRRRPPEEWYNGGYLERKGEQAMRLQEVVVGALLVTLVLGIFGCGPSGGPATSPSPGPGQTQAPEILKAEIVGVRVLSSGDAVQPNQNVVFTGRGPANVQIRVYQGGNLLDTTSTSASGEFTFTWNSGSTEGTFLLEFAAKDPVLVESPRISFTLVVDGTPPELSSVTARASTPSGGTPPRVTVVFSEPIVVNDMALFTLPLGGFWTVSVTGSSVFIPTSIQLATDRKTVTITGNAVSQLVAGDSVIVGFAPAGPLVVTDEAGNACVSPTVVSGTVAP
jgi:hypothetical protein